MRWPAYMCTMKKLQSHKAISMIPIERAQVTIAMMIAFFTVAYGTF